MIDFEELENRFHRRWTQHHRHAIMIFIAAYLSTTHERKKCVCRRDHILAINQFRLPFVPLLWPAYFLTKSLDGFGTEALVVAASVAFLTSLRAVVVLLLPNTNLLLGKDGDAVADLRVSSFGDGVVLWSGLGLNRLEDLLGKNPGLAFCVVFWPCSWTELIVEASEIWWEHKNKVLKATFL